MTSKLTREALDDETLAELIAFRRSRVEYCQKEGLPYQKALHDSMMLALEELQERRKADSEPVAVIDQANLDYLRSGADADVWPPEREEMGDVLLYRHAQQPVVPNYLETLPCPVLLEPGMRFGKGVKTRLVLDAIQRRAEHYAELEAMTPEERAEYDANIEAFKAMLPQPAPELIAIVERLNLSGYEHEDGEVTPQNAAAVVDTLLQQLDDAVQSPDAQPTVDSDFIPKNLDKALGVVGVALPESKEEFNLQVERWIQRLIDRVIRYADEFKEQPAPERDNVRREHAEWSQATFGNVGPVGPLKHLSKEALEAAAEPGDLSEWADMQFLLWDAQRRAGITDEQITQAMIEKLAVNKQREWPEPKEGEPRLHIKQQPAPVVTFYRDGIEAAAKWIDQQREAYDSEHGWSDPDTGAFEFGNDAQREHSSTLEELAEGIRALHPNAGNSPVIPGAEQRIADAVDLLKKAAPAMLADNSGPDGPLAGRMNSPVIPDGLIAAVNRLLDSDGSRGCYSAIRCHDAREEVERLLAAAPKQENV